MKQRTAGHKVTIDRDKHGKFRWHIKAPNGLIIGASSQGYRRKTDCYTNLWLIGHYLFRFQSDTEQLKAVVDDLTKRS